MFSNVFAALVPALIFCAFVFIPVVIISWIRKFQTKKKRNPLNLEMLRNPGQSSLDEIEKTSDGIMECLFIFATTPVYIYALAITQYVANQKNINLTTLIIYTSTLIGILIYFSVKLYKLFAIRNKYRLGYDCELMAGQELAILIKTGFNIFHDFPAANFNIDHIAVGPTGIFAIETKGRAKNKVAERKNWEVQFNGKQLIFPEWTETKPIIQAIDQAKWLKEWVRKATGYEYKVNPVLVLPGWYIKRTGPSDLKVYNGKNPIFLAKGVSVLSPEQIQAISFQIEQKCRTVTHSAYKSEPEGK